MTYKLRLVGKGDWIQTFTGKSFYPFAINPDEISIEDIAHALSMQCRFGGHCLEFYSVAEHSCLLHDRVRRENRLAALLHDAPEYILRDLCRPTKVLFPVYKHLENKLERAILDKYGVLDIPKEVKDFDKRILQDERAQNMRKSRAAWTDEHTKPLGVKLHLWTPKETKWEFLSRFQKCFNMKLEDL